MRIANENKMLKTRENAEFWSRKINITNYYYIFAIIL